MEDQSRKRKSDTFLQDNAIEITSDSIDGSSLADEQTNSGNNNNNNHNHSHNNYSRFKRMNNNTSTGKYKKNQIIRKKNF